jgi:hypothetical protein
VFAGRRREPLARLIDEPSQRCLPTSSAPAAATDIARISAHTQGRAPDARRNGVRKNGGLAFISDGRLVALEL